MSVPNTTPFVLATPDSINLPGSRSLAASGGLDVPDTGAGGKITVTTVGNLKDLNEFGTNGFVNYNSSSSPKFVPLTFQEGSGIAITNPNGQGGNPSFSVIPNTSLQQVQVQNNGGSVDQAAVINFVAGANTSITTGLVALPFPHIDVTIAASTSFAPKTATYILKTPDAGLPDAQALNSLDAGILKVGAGTGVISTAIGNTDYQSASSLLTDISSLTPDQGLLIIGTGAGLGGITPGPAGTVLTSAGSSTVPSWDINTAAEFPWNLVSVNTLMSPYNGYSIEINSGNLNLTLPVKGTYHLGANFKVTCPSNTSSFTIRSSANQSIVFNGSIYTNVRVLTPISGASIELVCASVSSTDTFVVTNYIGTFSAAP